MLSRNQETDQHYFPSPQVAGATETAELDHDQLRFFNLVFVGLRQQLINDMIFIS